MILCCSKKGKKKSANDLAGLFKKSSKFCAKQLQKYYDENQIFVIDGCTYPLIEMVQSGPKTTLALHEHPKVLEKFKQLCLKDGFALDIPQKREGMLSSVDLGQAYKKAPINNKDGH